MRFYSTEMSKSLSQSVKVQRILRTITYSEDTYEVIKRVHIATGHGGRDRVLKELGTKYANITTWAIEIV